MKNLFFSLSLAMVGVFSYASPNVENDLTVETETTTIEVGDVFMQKTTIDMGLLGCTTYVTVVDKDTKEVLCEYEYYDEDCDADMAILVDPV